MRPILLPARPQRILIVKPSALGDIVHALPVLHLLKRRWPAAKISWVVATPFASLLRDHPLVSEVLPFDRRRLGESWRNPAAAGELMQFTKTLRERQFDLVIDLQGLFRSAWIARKTGAALRVGFAYAREGAPLFYTHKVESSPLERHAIERYLDVAEVLGCGRGPIVYDFGLTDALRDSTASLRRAATAGTGPAGTGPAATGPVATGPTATGPAETGAATTRNQATTDATTEAPADATTDATNDAKKSASASASASASSSSPAPASTPASSPTPTAAPDGDRPYAVLLPGTNWATKRWPADKFAKLVTPLRDRFGLASVYAGTSTDAQLATAGVSEGAIDLCGQTDLKQLAALIEGASLVIANDSGPMHIAAALGRPLVTLFGPTNPVRTGPHLRPESVLRLDLPCSPCYARRCVHTSCLNWLEPQSVLDAAAAQIEQHRIEVGAVGFEPTTKGL